MPSKQKRLPSRGQHWKRKDYIEASRQLREAGFNVKLKGNRKNTPQEKSAVRRLINQRGEYVHAYTAENRFKFIPAKKESERRKWAEVATPKQFTPNGVFVQIPKGIDLKKSRPRIRKGAIEFTFGKRRTVYLPLDPTGLALDPSKEVKRVIGRRTPEQLNLTVRGFAGTNTYLGLEQFNAYLTSELLPDLTSPDRKGGPLTPEKITQIFGIRLTYRTRKQPPPRKSPRKSPKRKK